MGNFKGDETVFARVAQDMGSDFDSLRVALACDSNRFPDDDEFRRDLLKNATSTIREIANAFSKGSRTKDDAN